MKSAGGPKWSSVCVWVALLLGMMLPLSSSWAQKQPKAASKSKSLTSRVNELKKEIESQKQLIEAQQASIEAQQAAADSQATRITELETQRRQLETQLETLNQRLAELESQAGIPTWESALEERLKEIEEQAKKPPELPPDIVSAGDFPGSIRIPGTDAAVKFGGRIRTSVVLTLDPLGTDDRFLTNSIPVGVAVSGEAKRTNISARASRLNFEFRTPGGRNEVRAFFEGDFAGAGNAFRLRHAYAQYLGLIVGQTWSTFSDPWATHQDLDFEGVSSENVIRQPQLRYWWSATPNTRVAFAVETPSVSLTGGIGVNLFPDIIGRLYWEHTPEGHLQWAAVLRQIRGEVRPGDVQSDWAYGASMSGVLPIQRGTLKDELTFQVNGGVGIARYINDLSSLGGQDAVVDTLTGDLVALPALGWYGAYEHTWKEFDKFGAKNIRSMLMWSYVRVFNLDFQPPDAYQETHRLVVNAIFSPIGRVDTGVEFIHGQRTNKDGTNGSANQVQIVTVCRF